MSTVLTIIIGLVFMLPLFVGILSIVWILSNESAEDWAVILMVLCIAVLMNVVWSAYRVGSTVTPWLSEVLR